MGARNREGAMSLCVCVTIPWVPDQACNPNNHTVSERTRIRHRKQGAVAARYPVMAAYRAANARPDGYVLFTGPVVLDVTIRWGYRQKSWDPSNLWIAMKYVIDVLQDEAIIVDDKHLQTGTITQGRAGKGQPETILTIRGEA